MPELLTLKVSQDFKNAIQDAATQQGTSRSQFVRDAIEKAISADNKKPAAI